MENKVGLFIANRRKELGMTQQQLADKLYVTDKAVSKWERGKALPDVKSLKQLAEALEVSVVELLDGQLHRHDVQLSEKDEQGQMTESTGKYPQYADDIVRESLLYYVKKAKTQPIKDFIAMIIVITLIALPYGINRINNERSAREAGMEMHIECLVYDVEKLLELKDKDVHFDSAQEYKRVIDRAEASYERVKYAWTYIDKMTGPNEQDEIIVYWEYLRDAFLEVYNAYYHVDIESNTICMNDEGQELLNKGIAIIEEYYPKYLQQMKELDLIFDGQFQINNSNQYHDKIWN